MVYIIREVLHYEILMLELKLMQSGLDGRALWLPDSPASCSERGCPFDEDTAPYCQVMNIWTLQQESVDGSVPGQAAAVQVSVSTHFLDLIALQHIVARDE